MRQDGFKRKYLELDDTSHTCKPRTKRQTTDRAMNAFGTRHTARVLRVGCNNVTRTSKKSLLAQMNAQEILMS
ncbi:IS1-like element transposase [Magnetococcus sp. PR-3]|uniref:IS1-like element transposase n=1 Tax=Magnetococcus sp. PR-3 TaxID=3120355 RepID=UPI003FA599E4